jgi:two-component system chemotaxis response regulator CheB
MPTQNIIVIGASAGGVEALGVVAAGLPVDLPAAVFVVLHIGRGSNGLSYMPAILSRAGPLPAVHPEDRETIQHGKIYIAPPDCHLMLEYGTMRVSRGPKENRTRPAINPLFRSAASVYDGRVAGVILTGSLDDGVSGLAEIKRQGGVAIVQDPATAFYPSMPLNALQRVDVDHVVPLEAIPALISRLAITERDRTKREEVMEKRTTGLTCPECRGPLSEERQGRIVEYACRVGHRYTPLAMGDEHQDTVERTLWSSIVALEEAADIADTLAPQLGAQAAKDSRRKREQAAIIKAMLNEAPSRLFPEGEEEG